MDCAKGIGIVCANKGDILDFEGVDNIDLPLPPLICIPTTAGSSADVSQFAIINDPVRRVKMAIISKMIVPDVALIDPITTTTMSPELTACTGMDALCHGIEAYVSTAHSPITDLHALQAIDLVNSNLLPALDDPQNIIVARSDDACQPGCRARIFQRQPWCDPCHGAQPRGVPRFPPWGMQCPSPLPMWSLSISRPLPTVIGGLPRPWG